MVVGLKGEWPEKHTLQNIYSFTVAGSIRRTNNDREERDSGSLTVCRLVAIGEKQSLASKWVLKGKSAGH